MYIQRLHISLLGVIKALASKSKLPSSTVHVVCTDTHLCMCILLHMCSRICVCGECIVGEQHQRIAVGAAGMYIYVCVCIYIYIYT